MRHWIIAAAVWGLLVSTAWVVEGEEIPANPTLVSRLGWARFRVVGGRILLHSATFAKTKSETRNDVNSDCAEELTVTSGKSAPSLRYVRRTPNHQWTIEFQPGGQVSVQQVRRDDPARPVLKYWQPPRGSVRLEIVDPSGNVITRSAPSFWHLTLEEPEGCQTSLIPALHLLRPKWELDKQARQVEAAIVRLAQTGNVPEFSRWRRLVKNLASHDFQIRQTADLQLRGAGQSVLPFLASLDVEALDAEQRMRIRRIKADLTLSRCDEPHRVAVWLAGQTQVWITQLSHPNLDRRTLAARQIAQLSGHPVRFDPSADPAERRRQIERVADVLAAD